MPVTPHYSAGAITLTPGSTTFTLETGALLANAKTGDMVIVEGQSAVGLIASITDDTEGELEFEWSGDLISPSDSPQAEYVIKHVGPDWFSATTITIQQSRILERITAGGNLWETSGQPTADVGYAGDYAIDITGNAGIIYFKDPDTGWDAGTILVGNNVTSGTGVPSDATGEDGDLYIRTSTGDLYAKNSGTWGVLAVVTGGVGPAGPAAAPTWTYSTTVTDSDPGSGNVRFNNANIQSVTKIFFDNTMLSGDFSAALQTWDDLGYSTDRGSIFAFNPASPTTWALFRVTGSVETPTGYRKVTVTRVASNPATGAFASNGVSLSFQFVPTGPQGSTGTPGVTPGKRFSFDTGITGDPGGGSIRVNEAVFGNVTAVLIDDLDAAGANVEAWIQALGASDHAVRSVLTVYDLDAGTDMSFAVTGAPMDMTGYWSVPVTPLGGTIPANDAALTAVFSASGDDSDVEGPQGEQGTQGIQGNQGIQGIQGIQGPASVPLGIVYAYGDRTGGNDEYTKVLLHMDGTDGSTTFTDDNAGGSAHAWSALGGAQIDTADSQFGTGSLLCDGTGDYIETPDHADFVLGASDFTIDGWFKCTMAAGVGGRFIMYQTDFVAANYSFLVYLNGSSKIAGIVSNGSATTTVTGTTSFSDVLNTGWHHFAFVRAGNVLKLFIDGVQEGGNVAFTGTIPNSTVPLRVSGSSTVAWGGWLDEIRLSVGIARWTANFVPPTAPADAVTIPEDGAIEFNRDIWANATKVYISIETFGGVDVTAWLDEWDDDGADSLRGTLLVIDVDNSDRFLLARVVGSIEGGGQSPDLGYRTVTIEVIAAGAAPTPGGSPTPQVAVQFIPASSVPARLDASPHSITNWDSATDAGWYEGTNATNTPDSGLFHGRVERLSTGVIRQTLWDALGDGSDTRVFQRVKSGVTWGDWYRLYQSEDELDERYGRFASLIDNDSDVLGSAASVADVLNAIGPVETTLTVTVGTGGDYATINAALAALSLRAPKYVASGISVNISLLTGFVMAEQVIVNRVDLGWIGITSVDGTVNITNSALTATVTDKDGATWKPAFAALNGGVLPVIGTTFIITSGSDATRNGICLYGGSRALVLPNCGVRNADGRGVHMQGSTLIANGADFRNSSRHNLYAENSSIVAGAGLNLSRANTEDHGNVFLFQGAKADLRDATITGGRGSTTASVFVRDGSTAVLRGADISDAVYTGLWVHRASVVNATELVAEDIGGIAVRCDTGSLVSIDEATITDAGAASVYAVDGGIISATDAIITGSTGAALSAVRGGHIMADGATAQGDTSGAYAEQGGYIIANGSDVSGSDFGFRTSNGGHIVATDSDASGCSTCGARAVGGILNITGTNCQKGSPASSSDIESYNGALILAHGATGGLNRTPNWPTQQGLILTNVDDTLTGMVAKTSTTGVAGRTITGTSNQVSVSNGSGVSGNPTISLPTTVVIGTHTIAGAGGISAVRASAAPLIINRTTDDGALIVFQQDGSDEGNIAVAGTTVSLNGAHLARWSQWGDGESIDGYVFPGTVMQNLDEMCVWFADCWEARAVPEIEASGDLETGPPAPAEDYPLVQRRVVYKGPLEPGDSYVDDDGAVHTIVREDNMQLNRVRVSDVERDRNYGGVFERFDEDGDLVIASRGDFVVRIKSGIDVARGDILVSAGDGTAVPVDPDEAMTFGDAGAVIGKVMSNARWSTYPDGSYIVPVML